MEIKWKIIEDNEIKIIDSWLTLQDKQNLCMTEKSWKQTAYDIEDCLKTMDRAQFKNIIGYINGKPAVAMMFGIEQIEALNLYNIVVNPKCRRKGVAKVSIIQLLKNDKTLKLAIPYKKVMASVLPENFQMFKVFNALEFKNLGFDGEYFIFEKDIIKTDEKVMI